MAILADDLIWATRLAATVRGTGWKPVPARSLASLATVLAGGVDRVIVDLTARAYDGIEAVATAAAAGAVVLAVGQHDDAGLRRRAMAAGADRFMPYRTLALPSAPGVLARWLAAGPASVRIPAPTAVRP